MENLKMIEDIKTMEDLKTIEDLKMIEAIKKLKQQKNAIIVAHYYVDDSVQEISDCVGDSYYLSKVVLDRSEAIIVFCGVKFMGESAKILSPHKTIVMADGYADCPMAHMICEEDILKVRAAYDDLAVVCYINSTAEIKALSDVCVTSSNALKIVTKLPQKNIFFIPDNNLGNYVASQCPDKNFIFHDGFCHVHTSISLENVLKAKALHPNAKVLVHPECTMDVVALGDYVGSTAGIIDYATQSTASHFIICTEMGILHELKQKNPNKKFYSVAHRPFCPNMKLISLEKVYHVLDTLDNEVVLPEELRHRAKSALAAMHQMAQ